MIVEDIDGMGPLGPELQLFPDGHGWREGEGNGPDHGDASEHGFDSDGAFVRTDDELAAVEGDGRDGEGGDEDGSTLEEGGHRTCGGVISKL